MSGENAIFDLPLAATMAGTKVSSGSVDIDFHDILTVPAGATEVTLSKTPKAGGEPTMVYTVNKDGTLNEKIDVGAGGAQLMQVARLHLHPLFLQMLTSIFLFLTLIQRIMQQSLRTSPMLQPFLLV